MPGPVSSPLSSFSLRRGTSPILTNTSMSGLVFPSRGIPPSFLCARGAVVCILHFVGAPLVRFLHLEVFDRGAPATAHVSIIRAHRKCGLPRTTCFTPQGTVECSQSELRPSTIAQRKASTPTTGSNRQQRFPNIVGQQPCHGD
jgi:hypothetical protein